MSADDCMAVPEVAKYLRISVSTVYELLRAGELTGVKGKGPTGAWYGSQEAIARFCDDGSIHAARAAGSKKRHRVAGSRVKTCVN